MSVSAGQAWIAAVIAVAATWPATAAQTTHYPTRPMRIETPGAGGYGEPAERSLEAIARDLRNGTVTRAAAERDYGAERVRAALKVEK